VGPHPPPRCGRTTADRAIGPGQPSLETGRAVSVRVAGPDVRSERQGSRVAEPPVPTCHPNRSPWPSGLPALLLRVSIFPARWRTPSPDPSGRALQRHPAPQCLRQVAAALRTSEPAASFASASASPAVDLPDGQPANPANPGSPPCLVILGARRRPRAADPPRHRPP